jgi:predicted homoserine dehydrogenase-like protein
VAKRDLKAGEVLDGIGGFCAYGLVDNAATARAMAALPIALSEGCRISRDVSKDSVLTFDDVRGPSGRLAEVLWREQNALWQPTTLGSQPSSTRPEPAGRIS